MSNLIKIVIADDNKFFVDALADSLSLEKELTIIGKFTSIEKVISFTQENTFDILILDVNFNGKNSLDYIEKIRGNNLSFKIISLTTMNNNFIKSEAKEKGIHCFVGKDSDLVNFKDIIIDCHQNKIKITQPYSNATNTKITVKNITFTKRKLKVLKALYEHSDKNGKEISEILNISENALKSHKRELFEITNTQNTTELIKFGIQNGLIIS